MKKQKKWSRPDLLGKPMNQQFQLYNILRMLDCRGIFDHQICLYDIDKQLHLPENFSTITRDYLIPNEPISVRDIYEYTI